MSGESEPLRAALTELLASEASYRKEGSQRVIPPRPRQAMASALRHLSVGQPVSCPVSPNILIEHSIPYRHAACRRSPIQPCSGRRPQRRLGSIQGSPLRNRSLIHAAISSTRAASCDDPASHQRESVGHPFVPGRTDGYAGLLQPGGVGFTFIAERVIFGRDHQSWGHAAQVLRSQRGCERIPAVSATAQILGP